MLRGGKGAASSEDRKDAFVPSESRRLAEVGDEMEEALSVSEKQSHVAPGVVLSFSTPEPSGGQL